MLYTSTNQTSLQYIHLCTLKMVKVSELLRIANSRIVGARRSNFSEIDRYRIFMAAGKKCAANVPGFECDHQGKELRHHQIDHIIPTYAGGPSTIDNGQVLCLDCHHEKSRLELRIFPRKNSRSFVYKRRNAKYWLKAIVLKKPIAIAKILKALA